MISFWRFFHWLTLHWTLSLVFALIRPKIIWTLGSKFHALFSRIDIFSKNIFWKNALFCNFLIIYQILFGSYEVNFLPFLRNNVQLNLKYDLIGTNSLNKISCFLVSVILFYVTRFIKTKLRDMLFMKKLIIMSTFP